MAKNPNKTEIVYIGRMGTVMVQLSRGQIKFVNRQPRAVNDDDAKRLLASTDFVTADDFLKTMEEQTRAGPLILKRWGALGDLIMLRAAASALARANPAYQFSLACEPRYAGIFAGDDFWAKPGSDTPKFNLDQVAEQDHRGNEQHRLDLFWSAMTTRKLELLPEDWAIPVPADTVEWVDKWAQKNRIGPGIGGRKLIALQVRGSGLMKSLPMEQIKRIAHSLAVHADVVLVEYDVLKTWKAEGVFTMAGRDALHSIEMLKRCDLCVCFDSGVLWMAHAAACPVLCIMGPTRPAQRLNKHPLFDEGKVQAILLNELIILDGRAGKPGCEPCFERAEKCRGTYACMQKQPDTIVETIAARALEMAGLNLSLPVMEGTR